MQGADGFRYGLSALSKEDEDCSGYNCCDYNRDCNGGENTSPAPFLGREIGKRYRILICNIMPVGFFIENCKGMRCEERDIPAFGNSYAQRLCVSVGGIVFVESLAQLARIVSYDVVFSGIISLLSSKDVDSHFLLRNAESAIPQGAVAYIA